MKKLDQAILERLEDAPVTATERFYLLLIALGLRTGTWIVLHSMVWRKGDTERRVSSDQIEILLATIKAVGLAVSVERRITNAGLLQMEGDRERLNELVDVLVASDEDTLECLKEAIKARDDAGIGQALGYPATAVEGFVTGRRKDLSDLPLSIQLSDEGLALEWVLSADHWKEELVELKGWLEAGHDASQLIHSDFEHAHSRLGYDLLLRFRRMAEEVATD